MSFDHHAPEIDEMMWDRATEQARALGRGPLFGMPRNGITPRAEPGSSPPVIIYGTDVATLGGSFILEPEEAQRFADYFTTQVAPAFNRMAKALGAWADDLFGFFRSLDVYPFMTCPRCGTLRDVTTEDRCPDQACRDLRRRLRARQTRKRR